MLDWERLAADGFFSRRKGGGEEVEYGFKGKGTTTHLLVDGNGSPVAFTSTTAKGDEREQVEPLLDRVHKYMTDVSKKDVIPILEADKGYDSEQFRDEILRRKTFPGFADVKSQGKRRLNLF